MYNTIDKSTLKPGDIVGIKIPTKIGWGYFRYAETIPMTIANTPSKIDPITSFKVTINISFMLLQLFHSLFSD